MKPQGGLEQERVASVGAGAFGPWMESLEARHLENLTFSEASRSLRALSATYVENRHRLGRGAALSGAGKRAAFALFYGPLHFLLVREIVATLPHATRADTIVDLGCGTGAAGAAWASACSPGCKVFGVDKHPWAVSEASATYRAFGLQARSLVGDVATFEFPKRRASILAAFVLNELPDEVRERTLQRLMDRAAHGDRVLIVEPIAGSVTPWWARWQKTFQLAGGRADEWRTRPTLPAIVAKLDRAAGLRHRELTGRSLWLPGAH